MAKRQVEYAGMEDDPLWYKDAIVYEAHVRAFRDSSGDGTGDFRGLIEKMNYLRDLGVTAIWLTPFYPSPLRDDGYDIADYTGIHPAYGTLRDFRDFLRSAHRHNIRVIIELVLNHTSDQHPWFQRARRARPGSRWNNFYVWSDSQNKYGDARIIFKDFESSNWAWDPRAKAYYWHRFYHHQPDLNYDNPNVQKAIFRAINFWFTAGVDGMRLDAVPYLFEREGTNCENLPDTYEFLRSLRGFVDSKFKNKMLLAEANQWPEDAVAYFGEGDKCHMAFHFPLMTRFFMALRMEDRFPIIDILDQTPAIPESCQWALFLRNHDELTLEMVTDEARDYMYRVYAHDPQMRINLGIRRRLAPLLENNRRRIEVMNGMLMSLPGTPVIYYGDEIGMGDNYYLGDRNGVRTPMQWSADRNAGFSRANPQQLYLPIIIDPEYHYESINVEAQNNNSNSLLWWMKRLIALRRHYRAFGRGSIEFLYPANHKILAYIRRYQDESILVVANLSRFVQYVELDLSSLEGIVPVELFGRTEFPPIGKLPYLLTLGPHSFYWFSLESKRDIHENIEIASHVSRLPVLTVTEKWETIFKGKTKETLEEYLPRYLKICRWFGGKARRTKSATIIEAVPIPDMKTVAYITLVQVDYWEGDSEIYALPLTHAVGEEVDKVMKDHPLETLARLQFKLTNEDGVLYDALVEKSFCKALMQLMVRRHRRKGKAGEIEATLTKAFHKIWRGKDLPFDPSILKTEQSNTSVVYGDRFILKFFRRPEAGINPDLEIGLFLTQKGFAHVPPVAGAIEYRRSQEEPMTLAVLNGFVINEGDAWRYTLDVLSHYFEQALTRRNRRKDVSAPLPSPLDLAEEDIPAFVAETVGHYLEAARVLGERTAELHVSLASDPEAPSFAPEPFSRLYQRSVYQTMRNLSGKVFQLLNQYMKDLPEKLRAEAENIAAREADIRGRFRLLLDKKITAMRIRCHGDYHLGQVLHTGKDFVIIDFEGEPARPITERRIKRSPLRDVAGMLRSFHYAAYSSLFTHEEQGLVRAEDLGHLEDWARLWYTWVSAIFLKAYRQVANQGGFLPEDREELQLLLDIYLLEKAIYELGYELNNRPPWIRIPIRGIQQLLETKA